MFQEKKIQVRLVGVRVDTFWVQFSSRALTPFEHRCASLVVPVLFCSSWHLIVH